MSQPKRPCARADFGKKRMKKPMAMTAKRKSTGRKKAEKRRGRDLSSKAHRNHESGPDEFDSRFYSDL